MRFFRVLRSYFILASLNATLVLGAKIHKPLEHVQMPCIPLKKTSPLWIQGCQRCAWTMVSGTYEPMLECRCVGDNILRMDRLFIREVLAKCLGTIAFIDGALACHPKSAARTID
jgi:hypothetical protein